MADALAERAKGLEEDIMLRYKQGLFQFPNNLPEYLLRLSKMYGPIRMERLTLTPHGNGSLQGHFSVPNHKRELLEALSRAILRDSWEWEIEELLGGDCFVHITRYVGDDKFMLKGHDEPSSVYGEHYG